MALKLPFYSGPQTAEKLVDKGIHKNYLIFIVSFFSEVAEQSKKIEEKPLDSCAKVEELKNDDKSLEDSLLSGVKDGCEYEAVSELEDSILDGPMEQKSSLAMEIETSGTGSDKTVKTKACENSVDSIDNDSCESKKPLPQITDKPSDTCIENGDVPKSETDSVKKATVAKSEEDGLKSEQTDEIKNETTKSSKDSIPNEVDLVKKEDICDEKIEDVRPDTPRQIAEKSEKPEDSIDTIGATSNKDEATQKRDISADEPSTSGTKRPPSPSLPASSTKKSKLDDMIGRLSTAVGKAPEDLTDVEDDTTDKEEESDSSSGSESSEDATKHPQLTKEVSFFIPHHSI